MSLFCACHLLLVLVAEIYSTTLPEINARSHGNFGVRFDEHEPKNRRCYSVQTTVVKGGGCFIS